MGSPGAGQQAAQIPRDLLGVQARLRVAGRRSFADRAREAVHPVAPLFDDGLPHRAWPAVELDDGGLEETPTREPLSLQGRQETVAHTPTPPPPRRRLQPWSQDLIG